MSVSYGKGDKGKATKLHSELIRKGTAECENCGTSDYSKLTCAHIVGRRYSSTRTSLNNAFSLCYSCHRKYTDWPREFSHFITDSWAADIYDELKARAYMVTKVDWTKELGFLKEIQSKMKGGLTLKEAREIERIEWTGEEEI